MNTRDAVIVVSLALCASLATLAYGDPLSARDAQTTSASAPDNESARIRELHLKRLEERMTRDQEELRRACRYESEIASAPPARRVALTFDDGPDPNQTLVILNTLARHGLHATFFMIGEKMRAYPDVVAQVRAAGHQIIGNHSWSHPNFHDIDPAQQIAEIDKAARMLPIDAMPLKLFRYPYGNASCDANTYLHQAGYRIVGWHVDSCDWAYDKTGEVDIREALSCGVLAQYRTDFVGHVLSSVRAHDGGIVLFHEIHANTVRHLDEIIAKLLAAGFEFGTLDDPAFATSLR